MRLALGRLVLGNIHDSLGGGGKGRSIAWAFHGGANYHSATAAKHHYRARQHRYFGHDTDTKKKGGLNRPSNPPYLIDSPL